MDYNQVQSHHSTEETAVNYKEPHRGKILVQYKYRTLPVHKKSARLQKLWRLAFHNYLAQNCWIYCRGMLRPAVLYGPLNSLLECSCDTAVAVSH